MARRGLPVEVLQCPKCQFTYWAPLRNQVVWCPTTHSSKSRKLPPVQLKVVWDRSMESDPPAMTAIRPQRKLVDVKD